MREINEILDDIEKADEELLTALTIRFALSCELASKRSPALSQMMFESICQNRIARASLAASALGLPSDVGRELLNTIYHVLASHEQRIMKESQ